MTGPLGEALSLATLKAVPEGAKTLRPRTGMYLRKPITTSGDYPRIRTEISGESTVKKWIPPIFWCS